MNLLTYLERESILSSYVGAIDWWLAEGKFRGWDARKVAAFTRKLHNFSGLNIADIHHGSLKNLKFPKKVRKYPQLYLSEGISEGRDWIRHIRNAIAHGNVTIKRHSDGTILAEMKDYKLDQITQTAYILFPLVYLNDIKTRYEMIKKSK